MEKQYYIFWVWVCRLTYPACNMHEPYCHLWPASFYKIFPHYLIKGTIFFLKKVIVNNTCFLISSTTFIRNISRSKKNWARYDKSFLFVFIYITHYSCQTLMKLTFFLTVYPKIWNIRFNENPCNGNRSVQSQLTDWQTDFTELLFAFRNYADAPKNVIFYSKE